VINLMTNRLWRRRRTAAEGSAVLAGVESARELFGPLTAKGALANAALARSGRQLKDRFQRYIGWLDRQGYAFGSCEEFPLRLDCRRVYLRYDVHVRDLFGAFALAGLHEELQIPGSFQICWEHSRAEAEVSDIFLKLQAFDSRFVEFGLHCSPESRWIIIERFDGRADGLDAFVNQGAARAMMTDWLAAFARDGDDAAILGDARSRAEASLADLARSFRRHFGAVKTVSGHGTPMSAAYLEAACEEPQLTALAAYLHPVDFLAPERVREHGFAGELTRFDEDALPGPRIMFESPVDNMAKRYGERMAQGGGFVVLFHPASWTDNYFAPFLDSVMAPDWPDSRS
jgi:hypothetical protein